jgi:hypothetical protein
MKYLWEVSKNLICEPEKVFVNKETKCCYYLNRDIDKRFYKFENIGSNGLVAYNKWCFLFNSKENAEKWHKSKLAKQEDKNIKIINSNAYHYLVDFVNNKSVYTQEYGDVIYSMELIRELDKLVGKEEPKQAQV